MANDEVITTWERTSQKHQLYPSKIN